MRLNYLIITEGAIYPFHFFWGGGGNTFVVGSFSPPREKKDLERERERERKRREREREREREEFSAEITAP